MNLPGHQSLILALILLPPFVAEWHQRLISKSPDSDEEGVHKRTIGL